jgi:transglutaminase-like putative cysteine protease
MLAACRAARGTGRYTSGHPAGEEGSHAWVEVLQFATVRRERLGGPGLGSRHNRRVNSDYLVVADGREHANVASLSGTYDDPG